MADANDVMLKVVRAEVTRQLQGVYEQLAQWLVGKNCLDCKTQLTYADYPHAHCRNCVQVHVSRENPNTTVKVVAPKSPAYHRPPITRPCKTCKNDFTTRGYGKVNCDDCQAAKRNPLCTSD